MANAAEMIVAGIDVGTECVKAILLDGDRKILGRTVLPAAGYFQARIREALHGAVDEAGASAADVSRLCVTGYGARCADLAIDLYASESTCHARGARHQFDPPMTVIDLGGRDPKVIRVNREGRRMETRSLRKCAVGIGSFLAVAAQRLEVHPTRMMELAATADRPAQVNSYCSVFGEDQILEHLRMGTPREEIALGCLHSVADRVLEIGQLVEPVVVAGGIAELYPGVLAVLEAKSGIALRTVSQPIMCGALGAALLVLDAM
ncbi:MAG: acyl-CoA dehydratase activase [bacterium]